MNELQCDGNLFNSQSTIETKSIRDFINFKGATSISIPFAKQNRTSNEHSNAMPTPPDEPRVLSAIDESHDILLQSRSLTVESNLANETDFRPYRDSTFALAFRIALLVWFVVGCAFSVVGSGVPNDSSNRIPDIYETLTQSYYVILSMFALCLVIGGSWFSLLQTHPKFAMGLSVTLGPTFLVVAVCKLLANAASQLKSGPELLQQENIGLIVFATVSLIGIIVLIVALWNEHRRLSLAAHVTELSCDILRCNPLLFGICAALLVLYTGFIVLWLFFFKNAFIYGHDEPVTNVSDYLYKRVLSPDAYLLAALFLCVLFWTLQIFTKLQHFIISATVADWYFHRKDPEWLSQDSAKIALHLALTRSFGTISLAALLAATLSLVYTLLNMGKVAVKMIKSLFAGRRKQIISLPFTRGGIALGTGTAAAATTAASATAAASLANSSILMSIGVIGFESVASFIDTINDFALLFAGISGQSLLSSAQSVTRLVRANVVGSGLNERLIRLLLLTTVLSLSFLASFVSYYMSIIPASNSLSPYAYLIGIISGFVSFSVLRFLLSIVMTTIKATYICYLLDLDNKELNVPRVHQAFGCVY